MQSRLFFNPDFGQNDKKIRIKFFNRKSKYFFSSLFSSSSFSSAFDWNVSNIPQSDRYQRHNCDNNVQNHIRIFCWFSELDYLKHRVKNPWMHYCYLCSFKRKTGKVKVFVACLRFFSEKIVTSRLSVTVITLEWSLALQKIRFCMQE